jgi:hypothetical protein
MWGERIWGSFLLSSYSAPTPLPFRNFFSPLLFLLSLLWAQLSYLAADWRKGREPYKTTKKATSSYNTSRLLVKAKGRCFQLPYLLNPCSQSSIRPLPDCMKTKKLHSNIKNLWNILPMFMLY